ncbi:amidase domain-containing protein [Caldicellulosiruptor acetigenus]|uniref:Putative amidase domain-containing protein n=1 Tax=Caldicellulosiruptor acetigenus 6A TaxID=632516 RepID=G2PTK3_9FIRM|nr:amidase domain-containing protein [Caldicellulosiruptor acetigenus]AEM74284.1 hypothetical protein Calla_1691 [Caldicellulosiruptor acetigenus 6A]
MNTIYFRANNYFKLKLESLKNETVQDFLHLFDVYDENGISNYKYEYAYISYLLAAKKYYNEKLDKYELNLHFKNFEKNNSNNFLVTVYDGSYLFYNITCGRPDMENTLHLIKVTKRNNRYFIVSDEYYTEFKESIASYNELLQLSNNISTEDNKIRKTYSDIVRSELNENISINSYPGDYYIAYDRTKAVNYALSHTSNYDNDTNYNSKFKNFANSTYTAGDCQNFVSQCLWYGYGGIDDQTNINTHQLPMTYDWWCDKYNASCTSDGKWNWTYVAHFYSWLTSNNYGPRGQDIAYTDAEKGDIIFKSDLSHVYIITDIIDFDNDNQVDWNEIYVSAHAKNRLNNRLSSIYPSPTSSLKFVKIYSFK